MSPELVQALAAIDTSQGGLANKQRKEEGDEVGVAELSVVNILDSL